MMTARRSSKDRRSRHGENDGKKTAIGRRGNKAAEPLSDPALTHLAEVQEETMPLRHHVRLRLQ